MKNDLASDRTSDHAFLANHLRLFYSCAAYGLIHGLRENTLVHTELAKAQPVSIILKLFKLAVRVVQYKDRIKLSLPTSCPMKGVLARVTELLYLVPRPPAPVAALPGAGVPGVGRSGGTGRLAGVSRAAGRRPCRDPGRRPGCRPAAALERDQQRQMENPHPASRLGDPGRNGRPGLADHGDPRGA